MTIGWVLAWAFITGLAVGILDAVAYSPAWQWLKGG